MAVAWGRLSTRGIAPCCFDGLVTACLRPKFRPDPGPESGGRKSANASTSFGLRRRWLSACPDRWFLLFPEKRSVVLPPWIVIFNPIISFKFFNTMSISLLQLCLACVPLLAPPTEERVVAYDLVIAEQKIRPAGKPVRALTVNGSIPGPVLRFHEGDVARIRVHNHLRDETTSIHWHGLLVPPAQDGVPEVTTPLILPGTTHTFEFPIRQAGTYWFHSHTQLQEQSGVYGSIVITPKGGERFEVARDYVLQLSDWTNLDPYQVQRELWRGGEYFALKKGNMQSLTGALKDGALKPYLSNQWARMMPMDVSDVAYDAFWINGRQRSMLKGRPGERIRLRLINSAASTYFYTESATGKMTLVAADGMPVEPVEVQRLLIGMAETYDVLITLPADGRWEFRATAQDGSGHASVFLGEGVAQHAAPEVPKPDLYRMDHLLDAALNEDHEGMHNAGRPAAPYPLLRALRPTALPAGRPVRTIPLRLTGDMERYQWSFNGKTMAEDALIPVKKGEVLRFELVNDTMMHHPLHLHGHFFRLLNRHGDHSPLKHTLDIPPMGRATLEFEANEVGDWLFHCHLLYHMMSGMTRIVSYQNPLPDAEEPMKSPGLRSGSGSAPHAHAGKGMRQWNGVREVPLGDHGHEHWAFWGEASLQSHLSTGMVDVRRRHDDFYLLWEAGWEGVDDVEFEADFLYERYLDPNLRAFAGWRFTNEEDAEHRGIAGLRYRLPLFVWSSVLADTEGDFEFAFSKALQVTDRLSVFGEVSYDTKDEWEWSGGATFMLGRSFSLIGQYHSKFGLGGGVVLRF